MVIGRRLAKEADITCVYLVLRSWFSIQDTTDSFIGSKILKKVMVEIDEQTFAVDTLRFSPTSSSMHCAAPSSVNEVKDMLELTTKSVHVTPHVNDLPRCQG
jgi:hypothetical protein